MKRLLALALMGLSMALVGCKTCDVCDDCGAGDAQYGIYDAPAYGAPASGCSSCGVAAGQGRVVR